MWWADPNWRMTKLFLLALALMVSVMKLIAFLLPATTQTGRPFISWMLLAPDSVVRWRPAVGIRRVLLRILLLLGAVSLSFWVYARLVHAFQIRGILLSYLAVPILLLVVEFIVALTGLIFLPGGRPFPAVHHRPWSARSLADFWGNRWNMWVNDWFRYTIFTRLRRRPVLALFLAFAVSGLMHEWVINLPLYCLTGRVLFGTMMLYFLIQPVGILLERRFLKGHRWLMIMFAWAMVVAPSPLMLNEGMLRVLHLWPKE
jgi:hypothetical protein